MFPELFRLKFLVNTDGEYFIGNLKMIGYASKIPLVYFKMTTLIVVEEM